MHAARHAQRRCRVAEDPTGRRIAWGCARRAGTTPASVSRPLSRVGRARWFPPGGGVNALLSGTYAKSRAGASRARCRVVQFRLAKNLAPCGKILPRSHAHVHVRALERQQYRIRHTPSTAYDPASRATDGVVVPPPAARPGRGSPPAPPPRGSRLRPPRPTPFRNASDPTASAKPRRRQPAPDAYGHHRPAGADRGTASETGRYARSGSVRGPQVRSPAVVDPAAPQPRSPAA